MDEMNLGPFDPLLDIEGVNGPQDIFGNVGGENSFGGNNPFMGSSTSNDLAYGGNPFAGENFWNIFNGGNNPSYQGSNFGSDNSSFSGM